MKNKISTFKIIYLSETHAINNTNIYLDKNYSVYDFPDTNCNPLYPRGGCVLFIHLSLKKFVKSVKNIFTDSIKIQFVNGFRINFCYIPPNDSNYFSLQYLATLASEFNQAKEEKYPFICMGDLNARLGELPQTLQYSYLTNPDQDKNTNGKFILENIVEAFNAIPINLLKYKNKQFGGGYTFHRGYQRSQNDWCIGNKFVLPLIYNFEINKTFPSSISDHYPLKTSILLDNELSIDHCYKSIREINIPRNNHSQIRQINPENTNMRIFNNLFQCYLNEIDTNTNSNEELINKIERAIFKAAKCAKQRNTTISSINTSNASLEINDESININQEIITQEIRKWSELITKNDVREIWNSINFNGKIILQNEDNLHTEELANCIIEKCSSNSTQNLLIDSDFSEINQHDENPITEDETMEQIENIKYNSKTTDGISGKFMNIIAPQIIMILTVLLNNIFNGQAGGYPFHAFWCLIFAIPKKNILQIPNSVRFITITSQISKIYDSVIKERLYKYIKIPSNQTAYQKSKGCFINVMIIRIFIMLTKKLKVKLYIIFTDFRAAFDTVSRRKLIIKLINMGLSVTMITAIKDMYIHGENVMFHNGEYSNSFELNLGVKQGAASSGILFIAYIIDLINIFNVNYLYEIMIEGIHILIHADDTIILATSRQSALNKVQALSDYCIENDIDLQPSKCHFMCINYSNEEEIRPLVINNQSICHSTSEIYLGSAISSSTNINDHITADNKMRAKNIIKFYAFLRNNKYVPINIKLKVLESCLLSSLLYNAETWGNANLSKLEIKYREMLRAILGVRTTTCNEFVYTELDAISITARVMKKQYDFWTKIINLDETEPLKIAVRIAERHKLPFINHYKQLYNKFQNIDIYENDRSNRKYQIINKSNQGKSKYKAYLKLNPSLNKPLLYNENVPIHKIQHTIKLRTISHDLAIETGRRNNTPSEQRLCFCKSNVEDEEHYLKFCPIYEDIRSKYQISHQSIDELCNEIRYNSYIYEIQKRRENYKNI